MSGKKALVALGVAMLLGGSLVLAADDSSMSAAPATQPAGEMPMMHHRSKLIQPYGSMTSLTDEQKFKIEQIHSESLAKMAAVKEKEQADIMALLSDDQKMELQKVEETAAAERKERAAGRKKKADAMAAPTTAPAQ
jgi:Spy/CpxP family protein refolding chaperone